MTPIVAHPERHHFFTDDPARLQALVAAGAWLQITVDSLLGNHGPRPELAAPEMLRTYPDAVLATDAHNLRRCSGLSLGYAWVAERLGVAWADDLPRTPTVCSTRYNGNMSPNNLHEPLPLPKRIYWAPRCRCA